MRRTKQKKPKFTTISGIPCWACSYFVNRDASGLDDNDRTLCREYERKLGRKGLLLIGPIEGSRNEFDPCPAFGDACDTEDWMAEVLPPDRIVFRKYWNEWEERWTPIAFLPDVPTSRRDFVMSYEHCGQHSEACLGYYMDTKPCEPELYAPLLDELVRHFGYRPKIMKRLVLRRD